MEFLIVVLGFILYEQETTISFPILLLTFVMLGLSELNKIYVRYSMIIPDACNIALNFKTL